MHVKYPPISTVPANGSTIQNAFDAADMELHVGQNGLMEWQKCVDLYLCVRGQGCTLLFIHDNDKNME